MAWWGTWDVTKVQSAATKALKVAQKRIDKALDIQDEPGSVPAVTDDFFGQFGLTDEEVATANKNHVTVSALSSVSPSVDLTVEEENRGCYDTVCEDTDKPETVLAVVEESETPDVYVPEDTLVEVPAIVDLQMLDCNPSEMITSIGDWGGESMIASSVLEPFVSESLTPLVTDQKEVHVSVTDTKVFQKEDHMVTSSPIEETDNSEITFNSNHSAAPSLEGSLTLSSTCTEKTLDNAMTSSSSMSESSLSTTILQHSSGDLRQSFSSTVRDGKGSFCSDGWIDQEAEDELNGELEACLDITGVDEELVVETDTAAAKLAYSSQVSQISSVGQRCKLSSPGELPSDGADQFSNTSSDIEVISAASVCSPYTPHRGETNTHLMGSRHQRSESDSSFLSLDTEEANLLLHKKMMDTREVLEAREQKLLQLNKENHELYEMVEALKAQLNRSEEARSNKQTDLDSLTEEFTQRISDAERRFQLAVKEKESLKKQLQLPSEALRIKEAQLAELLQEGEKMAQEQLKTNNIVKKLRSHEKELEAQIQAKDKKVKVLEEDNLKIKKSAEEKEECERRNTEAVSQLTKAVERLEKDNHHKQKELDEALEKKRATAQLLEVTNRQVAELQKQVVMSAAESQHAALSAELQAKEELRLAFKEAEEAGRREVERLSVSVQELQASLAAQEREYALRESLLRDEVKRAIRRQEDAESRVQELHAAASTASQPLLRQLEALQKTFSSAQTSWETVEEQLAARSTEAERQLAFAKESEKRFKERARELEAAAQLSASTEQNAREEITQLKISLVAARKAMTEAENTNRQMQTKLDKLLAEVDNLNREIHRANTKINAESIRAETAEKRAADARDQLHRQTERVEELRAELISLGTATDISVSAAKGSQEVELVSTVSATSAPGSPYVMVKNAAGMGLMVERLREELQMRQAEAANLHAEVKTMERSRASTAAELAQCLAREEQQRAELEFLRADTADVHQRYETLLQLYGEKLEEFDELKLDLQDVKEVYRHQIDLLTKQLS